MITQIIVTIWLLAAALVAYVYHPVKGVMMTEKMYWGMVVAGPLTLLLAAILWAMESDGEETD